MARPKKQTRKKTGGRKSLFPGKRRGRTISITVTDAHLTRLDAAMARLNLTRSDVIALLVDRFSEVVEVPPAWRDRGEE